MVCFLGQVHQEWRFHPAELERVEVGTRHVSRCYRCFLFFSKPFTTTVIQVYDPTTNAEVERFYEDLQDLLAQFSSVVQSCLTLLDLL